jgi:hypothetical protein
MLGSRLSNTREVVPVSDESEQPFAVSSDAVHISADALDRLCGKKLRCREVRVFAGECELVITADGDAVELRSEEGDS